MGRRPRLRVGVGDLPLLMAYVYVVAMTLVVLIVSPALIDARRGRCELLAGRAAGARLLRADAGDAHARHRSLDRRRHQRRLGAAGHASEREGLTIVPELLAIVVLGVLIVA